MVYFVYFELFEGGVDVMVDVVFVVGFEMVL